jgi:hypothetical protein
MNEQTKKPADTQTPNRSTEREKGLDKGQQQQRREDERETDLDKKQDSDKDLETR